MTEEIHEQISALMDGELSTGESELLMRRLSGDASLRHTWERYHLTRDALRQELPGFSRATLAERVAAALEADPGEQHYARRAADTLIKTAASVAVAAVVAFGALWGVGSLQGVDVPGSDELVARQGSVEGSAGGQASLASAKTDMVSSYMELPRTAWSLEEPAMETQLNNYLVNHNEHSAGTGMRGLMPYMRIAGYDTSER